VQRRSEQFELRIRGWSAKPTGLRSARPRQSRSGGTHGSFTTQCVAIDGARLGVHDRTSILLDARDADGQHRAMYHCRCLDKAAGIGTVSEANGGCTLVQLARMPGRANGSILSLVNRAVKSNIFMNEWK
jgi:hypothetical protein